MSTTLQHPDTEFAASRDTTVAVIGPDEGRRRIVAKALANSEASSVREFMAYPARLSDVPRMMEQGFSVIMIDVDSDQDYALEIVEKISAIGTANVIVYSARNDPILMMKCMRAGARDFLPVPDNLNSDSGARDSSAAKEISADASESPAYSPNWEPAELPRAPEQLKVPEQSQFPERRTYKGATYVKGRDDRWHLQLTNIAQPSTLPSDFSEWDGEQIGASQVAGVKELAIGPKPAFVPAAVTKESNKSAPYIAPGHPARIPGAIETDADVIALFRDSQVVNDRPPTTSRGWTKWALLAAVPAVVGCLFLFFWIFPVRQGSVASSSAQPAAPQSEKPGPAAGATKLIAKPSPAASVDATEASEEPAQANQVPSEMMDAQLNAPARISKGIKTQAPTEEPPAGFAAGSIESVGGVPATAFGSQAKVKVVPSISAISAGVAEGMLIQKTNPIYPQFARESRVSGSVVLGATIAKSGQIRDLHIISGPTILAKAALEAVRTWRYKPYLLDNQPVEVQTTIKVVFALGKD